MEHPQDNPGIILRKVEAFLDRTGMSPSAFSRTATKDGGLIAEMRQGRKPRPETLGRIEMTLRKAEDDHKRRLAAALTAIRNGDGYVQLDGEDPANLPRSVDIETFRLLVKSGQLEPGRDSFLGGRPQTYRPI